MQYCWRGARDAAVTLLTFFVAICFAILSLRMSLWRTVTQWRTFSPHSYYYLFKDYLFLIPRYFPIFLPSPHTNYTYTVSHVSHIENRDIKDKECPKESKISVSQVRHGCVTKHNTVPQPEVQLLPKGSESAIQKKDAEKIPKDSKIFGTSYIRRIIISQKDTKLDDNIQKSKCAMKHIAYNGANNSVSALKDSG